MAKDVLIHVGIAEFRVAVVNDGVLERYWQESTVGRSRRAADSGVGDIVLGRVTRVLPAIDAAFVDIGSARAGFLAMGDLKKQGGGDPSEHARIGDHVREGDAILVQIVKDPMGEKGARLSTNLSLAGRLLVLAPETARVSVSRRITDKGERARLSGMGHEFLGDRSGALASDAGYILRTAAIGASAHDLFEDAKMLGEAWDAILAARASAHAPATLYRDLDAVERALRDDVEADVRRIAIDDARAAETARAYCRRAMPAVCGKIEDYEGGTPLFESFGIEDEIATLAESRVPLPSGGWITIETTEALTAIDVNSGSYVAARDLEETSLNVNRQAAEIIGRHLGLRGLGGLIVIDFIHLSDPKNVSALMETLGQAVARARAPAEISPMSAFGLVAITRKRDRDPLNLRLRETCPHCDGHGRLKTVAAVALDVLRHVEGTAAAAPGKPVVAHAAPEIVHWLQAHEDDIMAGLARRGAGRLRLIADPERSRESFMIETGSR